MKRFGCHGRLRKTLLVGVALFGLSSPMLDAKEQRLSPAIINQLNAVKTLMEEESWDEAQSKLKAMAQSVSQSEAQRHIQLSLGQIAVHQDNYETALEHFTQAYELTEAGSEQAISILYNVGQLQCYAEQWKACRESLEIWLAEQEEDVSADIYLMIAQAYAMTEDWRKAIPHLRSALALKKPAPASWHQLEVSAWMALENWPEAISAQQRLLAAYPANEVHWSRLADMQQQQGHIDAALSTRRLARKNGHLVSAEDDKRLTWLLLEQKLPFYAGTVLEESIKEERLPEDVKHLRWLFQCWKQARETDKAVAVLRRLQQLDKTGNWSGYQSELLMQAGRWEEAEVSLDALKAAHGGRLSWRWRLLQGMVLTHQGRYNQARDTFEDISNNAPVEAESLLNQADNWLSYLDQVQG